MTSRALATQGGLTTDVRLGMTRLNKLTTTTIRRLVKLLVKMPTFFQALDRKTT